MADTKAETKDDVSVIQNGGSEINGDDAVVQYCYKHKDRPTLLRCNQCLRPICLECAVSTPTGYRCKECVAKQQKKFNNSVTGDYVIAGIMSGVIGLLGSLILTYLSWIPRYFGVILGPALGIGIVTLVRKITQGRRSSTLNYVTVWAAGIGAALPILRTIALIFKSIFLGQFSNLLSGSFFIGWSVIYIALLCGTIWSNLKGFTIRRS